MRRRRNRGGSGKRRGRPDRQGEADGPIVGKGFWRADVRNRTGPSCPAKSPAAMFDMGGPADDAFGEDDFIDRPADRRHLLRIQPVAAIVDCDVRFGRGAVHDRRLFAQQMVDERLLKRPRLGQRVARAQRHRLAVLDPVEGERKGCRDETVQRGDGRGQPVGRRSVQVVERDERDMEEVGAASGVVARQRGDLRLHLRRRLGHDIEGVAGAHGWECSTVLG